MREQQHACRGIEECRWKKNTTCPTFSLVVQPPKFMPVLEQHTREEGRERGQNTKHKKILWLAGTSSEHSQATFGTR